MAALCADNHPFTIASSPVPHSLVKSLDSLLCSSSSISTSWGSLPLPRAHRIILHCRERWQVRACMQEPGGLDLRQPSLAHLLTAHLVFSPNTLLLVLSSSFAVIESIIVI
jgi:hypothetical protein